MAKTAMRWGVRMQEQIGKDKVMVTNHIGPSQADAERIAAEVDGKVTRVMVLG